MRMTGNDAEQPSFLVRWAAEKLGVQPNSEAPELRAAFLKLLRNKDNNLLASSRKAWQILSRAPAAMAWPPADDELRQAEEAALRAEVEAFAGHYWALAPNERRQRWQELKVRCSGFRMLRTWLTRLEAGLLLEPPPPELDGKTIELARHLQELFVLLPPARAHLRQQILADFQEDISTWQRTARRLRQRHPRLAALEPSLVNTLATWHRKQRYLRQMRVLLKKVPPPVKPATKTEKFIWTIWVVTLAIAFGLRISGSISIDVLGIVCMIGLGIAYAVGWWSKRCQPND